MYFTKTFALAFVLATGALAVPAAEATVKKPSKPALPVVINQAVQQKNSCGNDVTAYCCGNDNGGKFASCKALGKLAIIRDPFKALIESKLG